MSLTTQIPRSSPAWQSFANCMGIDPSLFFPQLGGDVESARQVCAGCVVRQHCLDHATAVGDDLAVLGGLLPTERARLSHPSSRRRHHAERPSVVRAKDVAREISPSLHVPRMGDV